MKLLNEIQQKLKAGKDQDNSAQGYKYRSCEGILEAVKPLLGEGTLIMSDEMVMLGNGVRDNVTQVTDRNGNVTITHFPDSRYYIKATVTIDDSIGESVSCSAYAREPFSKKGTDAPKLTGTASSYARKYALCGLFCIDDEKDADTDEYNDQPPQGNQQPNNNQQQNQGAW
jgi:hypothetical protein